MNLPEKIITLAKEKKLRLCCAESITGGRIAAALTGVSGASEVFYSGVVVYDTQSKIRFLDIPESFFEKNSVFSAECAKKMAENFKEKCEADICISTTGNAEGEKKEVFFALATAKGETSFSSIFEGNRNEVQERATGYALETLLFSLENV
jgi:PncC family amidohydrolase